MTTTYSALSIYGIIDRMDDGEIQKWLSFHKRLKYPPRFINVFTAARFNDAPKVLQIVRDSLPNTIPVWRGYDGKDAWGNSPSLPWDDSNYYLRLWNERATSPKMAAGLWFERRVKPYLSVIRETNAIVMLLNEAQVIFNAPFETECVRILGEEGIRAAAFRWATGTPDWSDYQQQVIADEVAMAAKYNALVGPHEYAGIKPEEQNSLINRYETLTKLFPKQPDVFIGEFGLAKARIVNSQILLDANAGWLDMDVSEVQYGDFIKATAKTWYLPKKVSFSLFDWMGWGNNGSFGVGNSQGLLDSLITASEWMSFSVEDTPVVTPTPAPVEIMPRPAEAIRGIRMRVKGIPVEYRNLRASWNYQADKTGELKAGDVARRFDIPVHSGQVSALSTGKWIYVEKLDSDLPTANVVAAGYVWGERITWEPLGTSTGEVPVVTPAPVEPTPAPVDPPAPPAAPAVVAKCYSFQIEASDQQHQLIEKALMSMLASIVFVGQAFAGAKVTLNP